LVIKFYIDYRLIKIVKLKDEKWQNIQIIIPDCVKDNFTLTIVSSRSWVPKNLKLNNDTRELSIRVGEYIYEN